MAALCDYCGTRPAISEGVPLCVECADKLKTDPAFADKLMRQMTENAQKAVERLRVQLNELGPLVGRGGNDKK